MATGSSAGTRARSLSGVRVVLVNYHCLDLIRQRLSSGALDGAEIVLVDNASDPADVEELARHVGAVALLQPENLGFAGGVNAGAADSVGEPYDVLLLLNPDVSITADQILHLVGRLREVNAAAIGPVLVDENGRPWVSTAGGPITLRSVVYYFLFLSHLLPWLQGFFWTRRQIRSVRPRRPHWLCGAVLTIDAEAWRRWGGLRTAELVYGEDVEWGVRVTAAGGRLHLARDVVVTHAGGASGGSDRWLGATERLIRSTLGPLRGPLAIAAIRIGLSLRAVIRRSLRRV